MNRPADSYFLQNYPKEYPTKTNPLNLLIYSWVWELPIPTIGKCLLSLLLERNQAGKNNSELARRLYTTTTSIRNHLRRFEEKKWIIVTHYWYTRIIIVDVDQIEKDHPEIMILNWEEGDILGADGIIYYGENYGPK
jgi:hypothetical protein